jgi:biopolymer transport protein ExbD
MGKIKMSKKPPRIDMTPMVDLFFLLLIFFILTARFSPQEAVAVDTPSSTSNIIGPESHVITLLVSNNDMVFFNVDNGTDTSEHLRGKILQAMGQQYNIKFNRDEIKKFETMNGFSLPVDKLKAWINEEDDNVRETMYTGIPMDSTDNQLLMWIRFARQYYFDFEVALKGDRDANFTEIKKVLDALQDNNVNKFNLNTNLEDVEVSLDNL